MYFDEDYCREWTDRSGEPVTIRTVRPEDKPLFVQGLSDLSPISIYNRFMTLKSSFSREELRYLTEVDGVNHYSLVVLKEDKLIAVGRIGRLEGERTAMDLGLITADCQQGLGIGRTLMERLAFAVRERGAEWMTGELFRANSAMIGLASTFLVSATWHYAGELAAFTMDLSRLPNWTAMDWFEPKA